MELNLSRDLWHELFRGKFGDDSSKADLDGEAGKHVKTVLDVYSLDVLGRMIKHDSFTFNELVEEYGGYPEYYEREAVLLAKRVYRYLDENNLLERAVLSPPIDTNDWLQILLEKNLDTESQDTWKVKTKLREALNDLKILSRIFGWKKSDEAWKCAQKTIDFLLDAGLERYGVNDLFNHVKDAEKRANASGLKCTNDAGTFANSIYYHTATLDSQQTGNNNFGPNYFYEIGDSKYSLTGKMDYEETDHDVCKKNVLTSEEMKRLKVFLREEYEATKQDIENNNPSGPFPCLWKKGSNLKPFVSSEREGFYFFYQLSERDKYVIGFGHPLYFYERNDLNAIYESEQIKMAIFAYDDEAEFKKLVEKSRESGIRIDGVNVEFNKKNGLRKPKDKGCNDPVDCLEVPTWIVEKYKQESNGKYVYTDVIKKVLDAICGVNAMNETEEKIKRILENNKQVILTGAPGTGKTYLARNVAKAMIGSEKKEHLEKQMGFCQFHPSYDYTDFVEGLRPKRQGDQIVFEREDGIFKEFCQKALNDSKNKYVFIIDEINRGDISKIFGELFYAIDPGYRGEKGKILTQYANLIEDTTEKNGEKEYGKHFYVPDNVYIIGTMNDIDRSVETMDFAIRRRFTWINIDPKETQDAILQHVSNRDGDKGVVKRMDNINAFISNDPNLGEAFQLGASYFIDPQKEEEIRTKEKEARKTVKPQTEGENFNDENNQNQNDIPYVDETQRDNFKYSIDDFGDVWKYRIEPLLKEYLRGIPNGTKITELKEYYDLNKMFENNDMNNSKSEE